VRLELDGGASVVWGSAEESALKATVLAALMRAAPPDTVAQYDVSAPYEPRDGLSADDSDRRREARTVLEADRASSPTFATRGASLPSRARQDTYLRIRNCILSKTLTFD
jgi:hypothetical protein